MKKLTVLLVILILLLPSAVLAHDIGDRIQFQGDVKVYSNEIVNGDVVSFMGDVTVDGKVMGDVVALMGNAIINGEVKGDVTAVGGHVIRSDTSKIHGKVTQIGVGEGIGNMIRNFTHFRPRYNFGIRSYTFSTIFNTFRFLGTMALAALCVILFPNSVKVAAKDVDIQPGRKALIGLATLLLTPVAVALMILTLLGIPLIPVAILLLSAAGFFGYIAISIYLGRKLNEQIHIKPSIFLEYIFGAVLLKLMQFIPFIGSLTSIIVLMYSIGITADTRFGTKNNNSLTK